MINLIALETGVILKKLRRGIEPSTIFSISFSHDGIWLLCCGSTGTVHLFHNQQNGKPAEEPKEQKNPLPKMTSVFGKIIPYFSQESSFGQSRLDDRNAYTEMIFAKDDMPKEGIPIIGVSTSVIYYEGMVPKTLGLFDMKATKMAEPWYSEQ